jgi:hypothetical protein
MREIYSDVEVKAGPGKVWDVVTGFDNFPDWNPFITSCTGELSEGSTLEMKLKPPGAEEMAVSSKVLSSTAPKEFRWSTGGPLFSSEHVTTIQPIGDERVLVVQRGMYSGLLAAFKGGQIDRVKLGLDAMNEAIAKQAEKTS